MKGRYVLGACAACSGEGSELVADAAAVRSELEALWERAARQVPPIPLEQLADTVTFTQPPPLALVRCRTCGLLYRNPREADVRGLYEREPVDEQRLAELRAAQVPAFAPAVRRLTRLHGGAGRGLEVGSYAGAFLAAAAAAGWRFRGSDVNPRTVAFLRDCGQDVVLGGIDELAGEPAVDVVACWNCFEQLPDPRAAALAARRLLRPGGILALRVPNGGYYLALRPLLDGPLRPLARTLLGRHNFLGFPYRHGFTERSLGRLLAAAGFRVVRSAPAAVLPQRDEGTGSQLGRAAAATLERSIRPFSGPPWLELYARKR